MRTNGWGENVEFTYEEIAILGFIALIFLGGVLYLYILNSRGYFNNPTNYFISLNSPNYLLEIPVNSNQIYLIVAGVIVIGFWLWLDLGTMHGYCPAPLCGSGVDGATDNLFKCAILFFWIEFVLSNFNISLWILIPAAVILIGLDIIRRMWGWIS